MARLVLAPSILAADYARLGGQVREAEEAGDWGLTAHNNQSMPYDEELDALSFMKYMKQQLALVSMDDKLLKRNVNSGFSGGEKKRNEIFQMAMLEPELAILDETDSGLDIDALKAVAAGVNALRAPERAIVLVTHYQRLLDYIVPDFVHVLVDGQIVQSGGKELALELEKKGYGWLEGRETSATT